MPSLSAADLDAMHQAANQIDTHNATLRGVATAVGNLQITADYNTPAGLILATLLQDWCAKLNQINARMDNVATTLRGNSNSYQATKDAGISAINPVMAALQGIPVVGA